jgi:DNA-binding winged helix-turn-helix (wHTH) protein
MHQPHGAAPAAPPSDFLLGGALVQPSLNTITRRAEPVHVCPKAMDVLVALARSAGEVVPQVVLIDTVWARRFVGESVLKTAVSELRTALGDDARTQRVIQTIAKRGYRLVAAVEWIAQRAPSPAAAGPDSPFVLILGPRRIPLTQGATLLGRAPELQARIDSIKVSRHHARITVANGLAVLEDLGSKNGTFVGGRKVEAPVELADGDQITLGEVALIFRVLGIPGSTATASPLEPDPEAGVESSTPT